MGININVYSYWGVRTKWNKEFSDAAEDVYEYNVKKYGYKNRPVDSDCDYLSDGMSCNYMVFGQQLYDSGDSRWGEMCHSNEVELTQEILDGMEAEYMQRFKLIYPNQFLWLAEKPWKLVNLVHYS